MSQIDQITTRLSRARLEYMRESFAHTNPTIVQLCETALAYMTALEQIATDVAYKDGFGEVEGHCQWCHMGFHNHDFDCPTLIARRSLL